MYFNYKIDVYTATDNDALIIEQSELDSNDEVIFTEGIFIDGSDIDEFIELLKAGKGELKSRKEKFDPDKRIKVE